MATPQAPWEWILNEKLLGAVGLAVVSDEHAQDSSQLLSVMEHVFTSPNGLTMRVTIGTAKWKLTRNVRSKSLLEGRKEQNMGQFPGAKCKGISKAENK